MTQNRRGRREWTIPKPIGAAADTVYRLFLSGRVGESRKVRRNLIRRILRELEREPDNPRLWCVLADLYTFKKKRMHCYRQALRTTPDDAEANAEIAELYATQGDRRYAGHIDRALKHCRGVDIEDSIIYAALEAARAAKDQTRTRRALRLGRTRFPDCSLFDPE